MFDSHISVLFYLRVALLERVAPLDLVAVPEDVPEELEELTLVLAAPLDVTRLRVVWALLEEDEVPEVLDALRAGVAEALLEGAGVEVPVVEELLAGAVDVEVLLEGVVAVEVLLEGVVAVEVLREGVEAEVLLEVAVEVLPEVAEAFEAVALREVVAPDVVRAGVTVVTVEALWISAMSRAFAAALAGVAAPPVEVLTRDFEVRTLKDISGCCAP